MNNNAKKIAAALTSATVLLVSGCGDAASKANSAINIGTSSSKSSSSSAAGSSSVVSSSSSTKSSSSAENSEPQTPPDDSDVPPDDPDVPPVEPDNGWLEQPEPATFYVDPSEPLDLPSSAEIRICGLSEALERFDEIESKTPSGSPEEIVQTLLERNILCFSTLQAKCWTFDDSHYEDWWYSRNSGRVYSDYITSADQIDDLFYGTYTEDKADYLIHYNDGWNVTDAFTESGGYLYAEFSEILKTSLDSFSSTTYASIISASDNRIVFGRYSSPYPDSSEWQPNNYHFTAVKEYGEWRLEEYIIDAPAYSRPYTELVQTARAGAPDIIRLAVGEAGNFGGEPYWTWYGFGSRIEWCAAFVSWCYGTVGADGPYFTSCNGEGIPWFKSHGQWAGADFRDVAPGDCIFFDWDLDGAANHVGLVIGRDSEKVYTVEGNRSDSCQVCSYDLNDARIFGYGLMRWN